MRLENISESSLKQSFWSNYYWKISSFSSKFYIKILGGVGKSKLDALNLVEVTVLDFEEAFDGEWESFWLGGLEVGAVAELSRGLMLLVLNLLLFGVDKVD